MGNLRLPGVQLPGQKAGASKVIKTRAISNVTPFRADAASRCPLPPGEGHKGATESAGCGPAGTGGAAAGAG